MSDNRARKAACWLTCLIFMFSTVDCMANLKEKVEQQVTAVLKDNNKKLDTSGKRKITKAFLEAHQIVDPTANPSPETIYILLLGALQDNHLNPLFPKKMKLVFIDRLRVVYPKWKTPAHKTDEDSSSDDEQETKRKPPKRKAATGLAKKRTAAHKNESGKKDKVAEILPTPAQAEQIPENPAAVQVPTTQEQTPSSTQPSPSLTANEAETPYQESSTQTETATVTSSPDLSETEHPTLSAQPTPEPAATSESSSPEPSSEEPSQASTTPEVSSSPEPINVNDKIEAEIEVTPTSSREPEIETSAESEEPSTPVAQAIPETNTESTTQTEAATVTSPADLTTTELSTTTVQPTPEPATISQSVSPEPLITTSTPEASPSPESREDSDNETPRHSPSANQDEQNVQQQAKVELVVEIIEPPLPQEPEIQTPGGLEVPSLPGAQALLETGEEFIPADDDWKEVPVRSGKKKSVQPAEDNKRIKKSSSQPIAGKVPKKSKPAEQNKPDEKHKGHRPKPQAESKGKSHSSGRSVKQAKSSQKKNTAKSSDNSEKDPILDTGFQFSRKHLLAGLASTPFFAWFISFLIQPETDNDDNSQSVAKTPETDSGESTESLVITQVSAPPFPQPPAPVEEFSLDHYQVGVSCHLAPSAFQKLCNSLDSKDRQLLLELLHAYPDIPVVQLKLAKLEPLGARGLSEFHEAFLAFVSADHSPQPDFEYVLFPHSYRALSSYSKTSDNRVDDQFIQKAFTQTRKYSEHHGFSLHQQRLLLRGLLGFCGQVTPYTYQNKCFKAYFDLAENTDWIHDLLIQLPGHTGKLESLLDQSKPVVSINVFWPLDKTAKKIKPLSIPEVLPIYLGKGKNLIFHVSSAEIISANIPEQDAYIDSEGPLTRYEYNAVTRDWEERVVPTSTLNSGDRHVASHLTFGSSLFSGVHRLALKNRPYFRVIPHVGSPEFKQGRIVPPALHRQYGEPPKLTQSLFVQRQSSDMGCPDDKKWPEFAFFKDKKRLDYDQFRIEVSQIRKRASEFPVIRYRATGKAKECHEWDVSIRQTVFSSIAYNHHRASANSSIDEQMFIDLARHYCGFTTDPAGFWHLQRCHELLANQLQFSNPDQLSRALDKSPTWSLGLTGELSEQPYMMKTQAQPGKARKGMNTSTTHSTSQTLPTSAVLLTPSASPQQDDCSSHHEELQELCYKLKNSGKEKAAKALMSMARSIITIPIYEQEAGQHPRIEYFQVVDFASGKPDKNKYFALEYLVRAAELSQLEDWPLPFGQKLEALMTLCGNIMDFPAYENSCLLFAVQFSLHRPSAEPPMFDWTEKYQAMLRAMTEEKQPGGIRIGLIPEFNAQPEGYFGTMLHLVLFDGHKVLRPNPHYQPVAHTLSMSGLPSSQAIHLFTTTLNPEIFSSQTLVARGESILLQNVPDNRILSLHISGEITNYQVSAGLSTTDQSPCPFRHKGKEYCHLSPTGEIIPTAWSQEPMLQFNLQ